MSRLLDNLTESDPVNAPARGFRRPLEDNLPSSRTWFSPPRSDDPQYTDPDSDYVKSTRKLIKDIARGEKRSWHEALRILDELITDQREIFADMKLFFGQYDCKMAASKGYVRTENTNFIAKLEELRDTLVRSASNLRLVITEMLDEPLPEGDALWNPKSPIVSTMDTSLYDSKIEIVRSRLDADLRLRIVVIEKLERALRIHSRDSDTDALLERTVRAVDDFKNWSTYQEGRPMLDEEMETFIGSSRSFTGAQVSWDEGDDIALPGELEGSPRSGTSPKIGDR